MKSKKKGKETITVGVTIYEDISVVWDFRIEPRHIKERYQASDDREVLYAENDVQKGEKFKFTMAAKDGGSQFDFEWTYTNIQIYRYIEYDIIDGRHVKIKFIYTSRGTQIIEEFDPEETNTKEMQMQWWQSILDNFKKYVETGK